MWGWGWRPYVPVAQRQANAARQMARRLGKGVKPEPVILQGGQISRTFWGQAWCRHLESFSDFANRLPRGRTYVRNGSVCHLSIGKGKIDALVSGSELYTVAIRIRTLPGKLWTDIKRRCAGQIASLLDLLKGRLSDGVMAVVTHRQRGLFPQPGEITMQCSCPDWAVMCKHVAAVLFGVGARLDQAPELLFALRGVDHEELVQAEVSPLPTGKGTGRRLRTGTLEEIFGIELASAAEAAPPARLPSAPESRRIARQARSGGAGAAAAGTRRRAPAAAKPGGKVGAKAPRRRARARPPAD
jgi:uncharacterized Zn finger protein